MYTLVAVNLASHLKGIYSATELEQNVMRLSSASFLLSLVCCSAVTPQETEMETKVRPSILIKDYKEIYQSPCKTVIAVSDHETIVKTDDTLYLLDDSGEENSTIVLAESRLDSQPTDIQAVLFGGNIYVTANYDREVHLYTYTRNASKRGLHRVTFRPPDYNYYPPSSNFTVSIYLRDNSTYLYIYMVYISETVLVPYDIHNTKHKDITLLPAGCHCHSQCLSPTHNYQGQVNVKCTDGKYYVYNIFEEELFRMPQPIHLFAASSYDRRSAVVVTHFEDINQDLLLILNCTKDQCHIRAAIPYHNSEGVQDIAITRVKNSATEIVYILGRNKIIKYFMLQEDGKTSEMITLFLQLNMTVKQFGGVTMSLPSLAVLVTFYNRTFLTQVDAILPDQAIEINTTTTPGIQPTQTQISEIHTVLTVEPSINETRSVLSMVNTTPTMLPTENNTTSLNNTDKREKSQEPGIAILLVVIAVVVLIMLFIFVAWRKCKQHKVFTNLVVFRTHTTISLKEF